MPAILDDDDDAQLDPPAGLTELPFPPVTKQHILNCSYHHWHPKYRAITPKARLIPLTKPFLDYLRADGIVLPSDDDDAVESPDSDSDEQDDEEEDVAAEWRDTHNTIKSTISELGGKVYPKLNWSAPKDATWMNANTMECRTPQEIYLLLKSSDFITHDLELAFDDTVDTPDTALTLDSIPYHLILRKAVGQWNPSVEFRCFVRRRQLLCICQRDMNHFDFLSKMSRNLRHLIQQFFDVRLRDTFPDENFVFDIYVPPPHDRVWLVDFNPWAPRTDPLSFAWLEILKMPNPPEIEPEDPGPEFVRLTFDNMPEDFRQAIQSQRNRQLEISDDETDDAERDGDHDTEDSDLEADFWLPELRLVRKDDPEAYSFNTPRYSAHKLPKDVVDASQSGGGLMEFAREWQDILAMRQREDKELDESGEGD